MKNFIKDLGSAKLAIVLFFVLAGISILGTLIPQGQAGSFYLAKYGQVLGKLILFFQLNDAYHSWWYITVLFLFMFNLIICSLNRLPLTIKLYKRNPGELHPEKFPNRFLTEVQGSGEILKNLIVRKYGFKKLEKNSEKGEFFYKSVNKFSFFSVYVVHLSLVIVIIGALIGAIWGYRGNMNILEGEATNVVQPFRKRDPIHLDFTVKLNKFILETYPNGMPKEYISNITIHDNNKTIDAIIKVNQPFKYKDITFYQASYNIIPEFILKVTHNNATEEMKISPFQPLNIKDRYSVALQEYGEAHGLIFLKVWVVDEESGNSKEGLIISGFPALEINFSNGNLALEYKDIANVYYMTGLQAKRDPGNIVVYIGFIVMMLGLFLVYYFDPKTYLLFLERKGDNLWEITIGGYAKRERESFRTKLKELLEEIKKELSKT